MENRGYALAAGLFTLLLSIGVVAAALWFSGETVVTENYLLVSRHPVSGLNPQAPVRYRGITVGKVVSIDFDPLEPRVILIEITVKAGTPLTRGTYAQLGSQGVTGLSYVMLDDDGSKPQPLAAEGDALARIEVKPSFFDSVTASGQEMIDNFNQVAKRVNVLLAEENQQQIIATLRKFDHAADEVASVAAAIAPAAKAVGSLAASIEPTARALPALVADTGLAIKRADALLANLDRRVESFERAAKSAEQLGIQGAALSEALLVESVPRVNLLLDELQRSSQGLERLVSDISDQPHSLVFGRTPIPHGPGEPGFAARGMGR